MEKKTERITKADLLGIREGETAAFILPGAREIRNAKSFAYQMQRIMGCRYKIATDYKNLRLVIRKEAI